MRDIEVHVSWNVFHRSVDPPLVFGNLGFLLLTNVIENQRRPTAERLGGQACGATAKTEFDAFDKQVTIMHGVPIASFLVPAGRSATVRQEIGPWIVEQVVDEICFMHGSHDFHSAIGAL